MARLGLALASAVAAVLLSVVLALLLLRVSLWLCLQAGGEPLLDLRLGFALLGLRRERRIAVSGGEGRTIVRRLAGEAARRVRRGRPPVTAPGGAGDEQPGRPAAAARVLRRVRPLLGGLVRALSLEQVALTVAVSAGDAAGTALLCGLLHAAGGTALALMATAPGAPRSASFSVVPRWSGRAGVRLEFVCIAKPRLSQAILAAWRVYRAYRGDGPAHDRGAGRGAPVRVPPAGFAPATWARR